MVRTAIPILIGADLLPCPTYTYLVSMESRVIESKIEVATSDGIADGYVYHQDAGTPRPGVAFYTDIRGIRQANRDMACRLAAEGYTVLLPNVFYRTGRPPVMDPKAEGEEMRKRFGEIRAPLIPSALDDDARSYAGFLDGQDSVGDGPMGAVGYCFTGGLALRTAAVLPDRIVAAASFHGGGLFTDQPSSPHLVLPGVKAELYFGHAFEDGSMPANAIAEFEEALRGWGGAFESEIYTAARHGWTVPDSKAYDQAEAERAYAKLVSLFKRTLG